MDFLNLDGMGKCVYLYVMPTRNKHYKYAYKIFDYRTIYFIFDCLWGKAKIKCFL